MRVSVNSAAGSREQAEMQRFRVSGFKSVNSIKDALEHAQGELQTDHLVSQAVLEWWDDGKLTLLQRMVASVVFSYTMEAIVTIVIVYNLVLVVIQTDEEAKCFPEYSSSNFEDCGTNGENIAWLKYSNLALLIFYSFEAGGKIFVAHFAYFKGKDNLLDFVICCLGWLGEFLNGLVGLSWLRVFRLWRLFRIINRMARIPEIHMLVAGLAGAIRAIFFGGIMLLMTLLFCSILLVQFIHPIAIELNFGECERCARGYRSVVESILTLFQQIVAGDSWGMINIPVIEKSPYLGLLLPGAQLLIAMGIMNLILAVVVDRSVEAREQNKAKMAEEERVRKQERKLRLLKVISEFDEDASGTLSRAEIDGALQSPKAEEFQHIMKVADVSAKELSLILDALSAETDDGEVSYDRLCTVIHDIEDADLRKLAVVSQIHTSQKLLENAHTLKSHGDTFIKMEKHLRIQGLQMEELMARMSIAGPCTPPSPLKTGLHVNEYQMQHESSDKFVVGFDSERTNSQISNDFSDICHEVPVETACRPLTPLEEAAGMNLPHLLDMTGQWTRGGFSDQKFVDEVCQVRSQLLQDLNRVTARFNNFEESRDCQQGFLLHAPGRPAENGGAFLDSDRCCGESQHIESPRRPGSPGRHNAGQSQNSLNSFQPPVRPVSQVPWTPRTPRE